MTPPSQSSPPRRWIREAVIQLLHADSPHNEQDLWPLVLAHSEAKIIRTRTKALLHLQQNRPQLAQPLLTKPANTLSLLETLLDHPASPKAFRELHTAEQQLETLLDKLRRELKSDRDPEALASTLKNIQQHNQTSLTQLNTLRQACQPSPPQPLANFSQTLPPLEDSARLLSSLFGPQPKDIPELDNLRSALSENELLKKDASSLLTLVRQHLPTTDTLIAQHLQNFSPERLNQVDRAILRLGTTELHHCPELPPAVAINEAIELARKFSDNDSPAFVNGILDKLKPSPSSKTPPTL